MVDMFEKEVQCTLCPDTFEPLIEPEEDKGGAPAMPDMGGMGGMGGMM